MNHMFILAFSFTIAVAVSIDENSKNLGISQEDFLREDTASDKPAFSDNHFWLSVSLQKVNWRKIFSSAAPFLSKDQANVVLNVAGKDNVNPLIVMTILMMEDETTISNLQRKELIEKISTITDTLEDEFEAFDKTAEKVKGNAAVFAVWTTVQSSDEKLAVFLDLYQNVVNDNADALKDAFNEPIPTGRSLTALRFPWPIGTSWIAGGTHSNTGSGTVWSSYDFIGPSPDNCYAWGCPTPYVTAAHSGTVATYPYSECNVVINDESGEYSTSYYHMEGLVVQPGESVTVGQNLGRYADDLSTALCDGGRSTGPHLHFALHDAFGRPMNLHNHYLSGYRVNAGTENYDTDCERCYMEKNGQKYCPYGDWLLNDAGDECVDVKPKTTCEKRKARGKCGKKWNKINCKETCGYCGPSCAAMTCQNGGTCTETNGVGLCTCPEGYSGTLCTTACTNNPEYDSECGGWTWACNDSTHGQFMRDNCPKACGFCS